MYPLWDRHCAGYLSSHTISGPHYFPCEGGGTIIGTRKRLLCLFTATEQVKPTPPSKGGPQCCSSDTGQALLLAFTVTLGE